LDWGKDLPAEGPCDQHIGAFDAAVLHRAQSGQHDQFVVGGNDPNIFERRIDLQAALHKDRSPNKDQALLEDVIGPRDAVGHRRLAMRIEKQTENAYLKSPHERLSEGRLEKNVRRIKSTA